MLRTICTMLLPLAALLQLATNAPLAGAQRGSFCANRPQCYQDGSQCCVYRRNSEPNCRDGFVCTYPKLNSGRPSDDEDTEAPGPYGYYEYSDSGPQICQPGRAIFKSDFRRGPALTVGEPTALTIEGCASFTAATSGAYSFSTFSETDPVLYLFDSRGRLIAVNDDCFSQCFDANTYEEYLACQAALATVCSSGNGLDSGLISVDLEAGKRYAVCVAGFSSCCSGDEVAVSVQAA